MRGNGYLEASGQNLTPPFAAATSISYKTGKFPLSDNVCGIYFMFLCIIFIWPCDLVLRPFQLGDVWWIKLRKHQFLASYNYPFLSYVWLNLITLPSPGTVTVHALCHVTYHWGQKWSTLLKSLNPIYLFTLSLLRCYDED